MSVIDDSGTKRTFTSIANVDYNGIVTSPFAIKNDSNIFYSDIITFNGRYGSTLHAIGTSTTSSLYPNTTTTTPPSGCTLALAGDLFIFNSTTTTQAPIIPTRGVVGIGTASVASGYIMSVYGGDSYYDKNVYVSGNVGIGTASGSYSLNVNGNINGVKLFYNGQDADARYALASQGIGNLSATGTGNFVKQNSPTINSPTINTPTVNNGLTINTPSNGASLDLFTNDVNIQQNNIDSNYKQVNLNICANPNGVAKSSFLKAVIADGWNGTDTIVYLQASGGANSGHNHSCRIVVDASYNTNNPKGYFGGTISFISSTSSGEYTICKMIGNSDNGYLYAPNATIDNLKANNTYDLNTISIPLSCVNLKGMNGLFIWMNKWWYNGYGNLSIAIKLYCADLLLPQYSFELYWIGRATVVPGVGVIQFFQDNSNANSTFGNNTILLSNVWDDVGDNYIRVTCDLINSVGGNTTYWTFTGSYRIYG